MPARNDAYQFMTRHVKNENLQKHMLAVEACDEVTGMVTATAPVTKCHSRKLATILPELIALFSLPAQ